MQAVEEFCDSAFALKFDEIDDDIPEEVPPIVLSFVELGKLIRATNLSEPDSPPRDVAAYIERLSVDLSLQLQQVQTLSTRLEEAEIKVEEAQRESKEARQRATESAAALQKLETCKGALESRLVEAQGALAVESQRSTELAAQILDLEQQLSAARRQAADEQQVYREALLQKDQTAREAAPHVAQPPASSDHLRRKLAAQAAELLALRQEIEVLKRCKRIKV